jgi:hypothetical protein
MRLLTWNENGELGLTKNLREDIPDYAILSHTWGDDEDEITFRDVMDGSAKGKLSYKKLKFCEMQAKRDKLRYFWIDTYCIDRSTADELSEAINSMFSWYEKAAKCYVYLSDVSTTNCDNVSQSARPWERAFKDSRWFTRGWTLQELIAPRSVEFFCSNENRLGDKTSLEGLLHERTGIPLFALRGYSLSRFSVDTRMSWATDRRTKREEDLAYCLLGIFDVHMSLIYGEGKEKALSRLRRKIKKQVQSLSADPDVPIHPVQWNYQKVHVKIIYWEIDGLNCVVNEPSSSCFG